MYNKQPKSSKTDECLLSRKYRLFPGGVYSVMSEKTPTRNSSLSREKTRTRGWGKGHRTSVQSDYVARPCSRACQWTVGCHRCHPFRFRASSWFTSFSLLMTQLPLFPSALLSLSDNQTPIFTLRGGARLRGLKAAPTHRFPNAS